MTELLPSNDFDRLRESEELPLLVEIFADGCAPCARVGASVDVLDGGLHGQARIVKMSRSEADANGGANNPLLKFLSENNVRTVPALLLFEKNRYLGPLLGSPWSPENIKKWMEEKLGLQLHLPPPLERYGIVMDSIPNDPANDPALEDFRELVVEAMQPFFDEGLVDEFGFGALTDDGSKRGLFFTADEDTAIAIAKALPSLQVIDHFGRRLYTPRSTAHAPRPPGL
ncbi:MAG TPA: thioredoxin family protein [Patescibacteria group bacterium]|jgi:hypothetical protein|nr:thioredoxin family protein [Patescibacteria group bacterium]